MYIRCFLKLLFIFVEVVCGFFFELFLIRYKEIEIVDVRIEEDFILVANCG